MMTEEELLARRAQLIERLGVYVEKKEQLAPVASRIYATLVTLCDKGMTFEQLVESLGASKSTVWTHLNLLESTERIEYFTKSGDRKRYYRPAANRLKQFIDEKIAQFEADIKIQSEILAYKQEANEFWKNNPEKHCDLQFNQNILAFMKEANSAFKKLKMNLTDNQIIQ